MRPWLVVGLTGRNNTGQRKLVIDVETNKLVRCEPPVQVGNGAFIRSRNSPAARMLRFHSLCRTKTSWFLAEFVDDVRRRSSTGPGTVATDSILSHLVLHPYRKSPTIKLSFSVKWGGTGPGSSR